MVVPCNTPKSSKPLGDFSIETNVGIPLSKKPPNDLQIYQAVWGLWVLEKIWRIWASTQASKSGLQPPRVSKFSAGSLKQKPLKSEAKESAKWILILNCCIKITTCGIGIASPCYPYSNEYSNEDKLNPWWVYFRTGKAVSSAEERYVVFWRTILLTV